ncbi:MAG TPA: efflux RND transporter permease subunit [Candidatus Binatia bacterium]|jgi:HAE1 family hydrophobic/amphiphilic exporter-1|nr:efflux RND transporter permease subunit [Candidatus Binatia bacterium]
MHFADVFIRRPVFATMLVAGLVVLGLFSYRQLGVDLFPNIDFPIVTVTTTLKGAGVEEMETGVTKILEEAINTIEGIEELRSTTREGVSAIVVSFVLEKSREVAAQDVRDKVASVLAQLPTGTDSPVIDKFDVDAVPVMNIAISGRRSLREVTELARRQVKEVIETMPGVGQVILLGGQERAINVFVDPDRLTALGLSISQVRSAIAQQNIELPGGRLDQTRRELIVRTMGRIEQVRDFDDLIVAHVGDRALHVRDLGHAVDGVVEPRSLTRLNGENAVQLLVRKQSGTNTVQVIDGVQRQLERLKSVLPADIELRVIRDQSRFINASIDTVREHMWLGAVLVALTVMLFMRDWRSTLVAGLAIPTSIIATFTFMRWWDFTLNNLTMLGLVLAVGIVIDDAVVVLENIFRRIQDEGESPMEAASKGTAEIALAVLATTLSLVIIFLPVAFMAGRVGRFFHSFGITTAVAIMVSLFISFTLTPALSARMLRRRGDAQAHGGRLYRRLESVYERLLGWSLRHRWVIVVTSLLIVATTVPLIGMVGKTFLPQDDQSELEISIRAPGGFTLGESGRVLAEIEERVRKLPGVVNVLTTLGDQTGRVRAGEGDVTSGSIYVQLAEMNERDVSQFEVMDQARAILTEYPDLRSSVQGVNPLASSGSRVSDVELNLRGPDLERLQGYAEQLMKGMRQMPGLVDVDTTLAVRTPELRLIIDREKASDLGLNVQDVAATVQTFIAGQPVSKFKEDDQQYDIWLRADAGRRRTPQDVANLTVASRDGDLVRLGNLVRLREDLGPAQIDRIDRQRAVTILGNLLPDVPLGAAMAHTQKMADQLDMPALYNIQWGGRAKGLNESNSNFLLAFALSFLFMYMVLAAQFESFLHPISILLALPLVIPFALLSLVLLGEPLNIYSTLGLFMLLGVVKKNGILQVDYTNTLRARGMARDAAILEANRVRLRPILMTTVMLVLGMIPIALGRGPGSGSRSSIAKVIVGGQLMSLLITLLITPVAYSLFDDLGRVGFARRLRELIRRLVPWSRPSPVGPP